MSSANLFLLFLLATLWGPSFLFIKVAVCRNRFEFKGKQGVAMGRSGVAHVSVDVEDSEPTRVRVGGQAVILFKTEIVI